MPTTSWKAQHTPGPWRQGTYNAIDQQRFVYAGSAITPVAEALRQNGTANADARLIAAAPELLEAAKWFIEDDDNRQTYFNLIAQNYRFRKQLDAARKNLRAVIAKATGEQT